MKVLYIAPLSENQNHSSGYASASDGILYVLRKMLHEGYIQELESISNVRDWQIPTDKYDICIVNQNISLLINNQNLFNKYCKVKERCNKIYFSFVWEADPYPKEFDKFFNSGLPDGILCPSEFVKNLLNKVNVPKFLYPHFIDSQKFSCIDIDRKLKDDIFTVLILGQNTSRKSHKESIISFCQEMSQEEDCRLIIKTNKLSNTEFSIQEKLTHILKCNTAENIKAKIYDISDENLSFEDMLKLYHSASVVLLPSKGEGFGLNLFEAMSCGIPCIYTPYHAWEDTTLNTESNYPIFSIIDSVTDMCMYGYDNKCTWFIPQIESIKKRLRQSYNDWKTDRKTYFENSIKNNRPIIIENYEYTSIREYILNILNISESPNNTQNNLIKGSLCIKKDFDQKEFNFYAQEMNQDFRYHRKLWEWIKIAETLDKFNLLNKNKHGLGFAVGKEPLSSYFIKRGCYITASDYINSDSMWKESDQYASQIENLNSFKIISDSQLKEKLSFENIDMNNIPEDFKQESFDFLWSSCALEHLGNLQKGLDFIENSLECLKPGGIAIHTTEFNCYHSENTIEDGHSGIYRKKDIEDLQFLLKDKAVIYPINYNLGEDDLDFYIDQPPYREDKHLKLELYGYECTSLLLIIQKI